MRELPGVDAVGEMNAHFIIGLGSNLGSRLAHLHAAVDLLRATPGVTVCNLSSIYETDAIGPPQPKYLNGAVRVRTAYPPEQLLAIIQRIESLLGRHRQERWAARTVDLDILWAEQGAIHTSGLTVPHPGLKERNFALAPLIDVAPDLEPIYGPSLTALGVAPAFRTPIDPKPQYRPSSNGKSLSVEVSGSDRADRLALAATVFASSFYQVKAPGRPVEVRTVRRLCAVGEEGAAFVAALVDELSTGFRTYRAVITSLSSGNVCGRLLGTPGPIIKLAFSQVKVVETVTEGWARICW
jgi:2-amino-4-hydroxy-6-hydroxymethyldihydropteridine diphosphokinase